MKKMFAFVVMMVMCGGTQKIVCAEKESMDSDFKRLLALETNFHENICKFPTEENRLKAISNNDIVKQQRVVEHAKGFQPLIDPKVFKFIHTVFQHKKENGTDLEKQLYADISFSGFILRLYKDRPLTNYTAREMYLLQEKKKNGSNLKDKIGSGKFDEINKDGRYTTQEERQLAGFIGISSEVFFINSGSRYNNGKAEGKNSFIEEGVYAGLVGACFEQKWSIAYQLILRNQINIKDSKMKQLWLALLNIDKEDSDESVNNALSENDTSRYVKVQIEDHKGYCTEYIFDKCIYKSYMELVLRQFFVDGNNRALKANKKAYLHIIGLGAGAWGVKSFNKKISGMQEQCIIEVCLKIIEDGEFPNISDLDFSWLSVDEYEIRDKKFKWEGKDATEFFNQEIVLKDNKKIKVRISKRDPAGLLEGEDENKLVVAMYAWDHGSLPGNEYWMGKLGVSGDPAAISCSYAAQMQAPHMNSFFEKNIELFVEKELKKLDLENENKSDGQKIEDDKKNLDLENQKKLDDQEKFDLENQKQSDEQKKIEEQQRIELEEKQKRELELKKIEDEKKAEELKKVNKDQVFVPFDADFDRFLESEYPDLVVKDNNSDTSINQNKSQPRKLLDSIESFKLSSLNNNAAKEREENLKIIQDQLQRAQSAQGDLSKLVSEINNNSTNTNTETDKKTTEIKNKKDDRSMIAKFFTYFKIGPVPVIPVVGIGAILAAIYYFCAAHGIGTGMVFGH